MSQKWQLPEGWSWKPLGDPSVCEIIMGQSPPGNTYNDDGEGLPFFQGKTDFGETFPTVRKWCTDPRKVSEPGDVLISVRAPVGPTNLTHTKCIIGRGLGALRPTQNVLTRYLLYALRNIEAIIASKGIGSTFQNISKSALSEVEIPVPDLGTQRRIVVRIEALLAEVREMRKLQEEISADTNQLMRATLTEVLPLNPNGNEPGWQWIRIGDLGANVGGGTPRKSETAYWGGTIPWVSPKDMKTRVIEDTQDHVTETGIENSSTKLVPASSILIVFRSGILAHSLPIAIAGRDLTINQDMKALILYSDFIPEYIAYALRARERHFVTTCVKKGPTVHSIVGDKFWQERLPIPDGSASLIRQQQIVSYLDNVQAEIEEMTALQAADTKLIDEMEQAILAQAFRGEL